MFIRPSAPRFALVLSASLLVSLPPLRAETPRDNIGKIVPGFALKDAKGQTVALADYQEKKAVVVVFAGTECVINNVYWPRLAELHAEYAPRGIAFLAINSNRQDTPERVARHAKEHAVPFPVLKDEGNVVADAFNARRTPEVFVLDAGRKIRYRGRIDDQFGIGYKKPKPTRRDLAEALDEILSDKEVSQPATPVAGCLISRSTKPTEAGTITYARHVAAILQKNCQECHRPGQIGPMSLLTYEDATAWSETIGEVVREKRMPPWHADPRYGTFSNDRRLAEEDRAALLGWIEQGTPKGDDKDQPPPRVFAAGWRIGKPDLILTMPEEFEVPARAPRNGIPYKNFYVDTNFQEDRWVVRAEARPGATAVVHHIIVFIVPPGSRFFPGNPQTPTLAGTAPGDMPLILPPGTAKKIPAGTRLVFQMHYTPNGTVYKDRSSIGLIFANEPPERPVLTVPIAQLQFRIPPGADNYQVESSFTFKEDGRIIGLMPHMHLRGKDFLYELIYPDGTKEILLSVPRYNFNWQSVYRLAKPLNVPKGTRVHCVAHFDNSAKNPNNPDPAKAVFWGDQTWEEMMIGWMDYEYDRR